MRDVLDTAHALGDLTHSKDRFFHVEACAEQAMKEGAPSARAASENLFNQFRHADPRDLSSGEDAESWLNARQITIKQRDRHFGSEHWISVYGRRVESGQNCLSGLTPDWWERYRVYLIFNGDWDHLVRKVAHRHAIASDTKTTPSDLEDGIRVEQQQFFNREGIIEPQLDDWLRAKGRTPEWLEEQFKLETLFKRGIGGALTEEQMTRTLSDLGMLLMQFEYEVMDVDSTEILEEAELSITLDEIPLVELAQEYGFPYAKRTDFLENLPDVLQRKFPSAGMGGIVSVNESRKRIYRIVGQTEPSLDLTSVQRNIINRLRNKYLANLEAGYIEWILRPER